MKTSTKLKIMNTLKRMSSDLIGALYFTVMQMGLMYCVDRFVFDARPWYVYITLPVALYTPFAIFIYVKYKDNSK